MSGMLMFGIGGVCVAAIAVWAVIRASQGRVADDMGTISGQWIAEHRAQERDAERF